MFSAAISKPIDVTQYENAMSSVSAPDNEASSGEAADGSESASKEAVTEARDLPTPTPARVDKSAPYLLKCYPRHKISQFEAALS